MKPFESAEKAPDSDSPDRRRGVWIENEDASDEDESSRPAPKPPEEAGIRLPGYREFERR